MRFFTRLSIRTKINLGITLIILIFGLVSAVMVVRITSRAMLDEIKKRGSSLTLNLAARTTEPLLAQDFLRLKDVVDEIKASSEDISYAFILDQNRQVMSHTFKSGFPLALVDANVLPAEARQHLELLDVGDDLVYDFAVPIQVGENRLGAARVGLSRDRAQATVDSLVRTVFHISFGTALAAILLGSIFAGAVIRRLNALRQSAESMVQGNLELLTCAPPEKPCWEIQQCQQPDCPAYGDVLHPCWRLPGTLYHRGEEHRGGIKSEACRFCKVYLDNRGDEIQSLSEAFDVMAYSLNNYINELRLAEFNIRRQQQILQTILDSTPDLVSLQDDTQHYRVVNQAFGTFFNLTEADILGKKADAAFGPELLTFNQEADWQILSQGQIISREVQITQGSSIRWFHVVKLPVYDRDRLVGLLTTARDISEIKHYQDKMIQALKMEELGKLARGLADELKTPLGIILGYTKILREDLTQEPETLEYVNIIDKQAQIGHQIVSDLLSFSRQGAGVREKVNLNQTIQEVAQLVRHTFEQDRVILRLQLDEHIPAVLGDEEKLKQVWMHLLRNAFESIPQEGVIALKTKLSEDAGSVVISMADNGMGIDPEDLAKIFEPFFAAKSTSLDIGLGLSFAYAVIRDHQGKISVHSPVPPEVAQELAESGNSSGPGTLFLIELPVSPAGAADQELPTDSVGLPPLPSA